MVSATSSGGTAAATCFILFGFERAGGIDQQPARRQRARARWREARFGGACRSARSAGVKRHLISGLRPSVPVPEQGASTRMRSKRRAKGSGWVPSSTTSRNAQALHLRQAVQVEIAGDGVDARFQRLRGLVAGRSAEIEKLWPGSRRSSGTMDCAPISCMRRRAYTFPAPRAPRARCRPRLGAVLPLPAGQQPLRARQLRFRDWATPRGRGSTLRRMALTNPAADRLRARFTRSTLSVTAACGGNALQIAKLIDRPCAGRCALRGRASAGVRNNVR